MNHHVPCSGVPPDDLLDLICHYKALLIRQLHLWFAGREAAVDHLLRRLELAGRIRCDGQRAACNAPWLASGNPACELAFLPAGFPRQRGIPAARQPRRDHRRLYRKR